MSVDGTHPPGAGGPRVREPHEGELGGAAPMRVLMLDPAGGTLARCAGVDGVVRTVEIALIRPLEPGAIVLVQGHLALARLDAEWTP